MNIQKPLREVPASRSKTEDPGRSIMRPGDFQLQWFRYVKSLAGNPETCHAFVSRYSNSMAKAIKD